MLQQAHFLLLNQNTHEALKAYCSYIAHNPNDFEALIGRAIGYYASGRFDESIDDSQQAILIDRKRYEGFYRRGLAHLAGGRVQAALIDLEEAASRTTGDSLNLILDQISRCRAESTNKQFQDIPQRKTFNVPTQEEKRVDVVAQSGKIVYKWYQTDLKIGIEIIYTLADPLTLKTHFLHNKLNVAFPLDDGTLFQLNVDLWGEILADKCRAVVGMNKIEIFLEKEQKNKSWPKLESESHPAQSSIPVQAQQQASYPSSSKNKRDWSKIDKEIDQDMEKNKEEYGVDPLNSLFKQIFANGDEKTKMAMMKSMQTSGGTVLSTNWDEVKEKDYEGKDRPSPPKGQEKKTM